MAKSGSIASQVRQYKSASSRLVMVLAGVEYMRVVIFETDMRIPALGLQLGLQLGLLLELE